jgi:hypothetical protein
MQSILQYRRIGLAVQKQLQRDEEKRAASVTSNVGDKQFQHLFLAPQRADALASDPSVDESSNVSIGSDSSSEDGIEAKEESARIARTRTHLSERIALGRALTGILARNRTVPDGRDSKVFVVGWEGKNDLMNPKNRGVALRVGATLIIAAIAFVVTAASAIDTAILPQAAAEFGVSNVVESIATGMSNNSHSKLSVNTS